MTTFTYYSALVRTSQDAKGLHIAKYAGFFTRAAWLDLGRQVARERRDAAAFIDLAYSAITDTSDAMQGMDFEHLRGARPGVWVVRPDQYADSRRLVRQLADLGVTRTVFLQAFEPLAFQCAAHHCAGLCQ